MNTAISIIMPVRNAEKYLPDCLDSIVQQRFEHWELVAVDDGSVDSSRTVLEQYAKSDARIKVFRQDALGIIPALNLGYAQSKGQWISRMDADDLMHPEKLQQLWLAAQERGPGHLLVSQVDYFREGGIGEGYRKYASWLNGLGSGAERWQAIYKECVIPSPGWLAFRNDFDQAGAFAAAIYPEDYDLCFRFFQAQLKPIYVEQALHYWRDYSERSSRNDPNYADNRFLDLKMSYFLKLSLIPDQQLVLWGAGKKGKNIAQKLLAAGVPFQWITNNPLKVNINIYGVKLAKEFTAEDDFSKKQFIIAVANPVEQMAIHQILDEKKLTLGKDFFFFA